MQVPSHCCRRTAAVAQHNLDNNNTIIQLATQFH